MASAPAPRAPLILLKSRAEPDKYAALLAARGAPPPLHAPPLRATFAEPAVAALAAHLADLRGFGGRYAGLVLTSQRAAEALRRALAQRAPAPDDGGELVIFAVGPATAAAARAACAAAGVRAAVRGEASGSGAKLAAFILEHAPQPARVLHVANDAHDPALGAALAAAACAVDELLVYVTRPDPAFAHAFGAALAEARGGGGVVCVVVFAPSGVDGLLDAAGGLEAEWRDGVRVLAIGRTTEKRAGERGLAIDGVAATPTPEGVWDCVEAVLQGEG